MRGALLLLLGALALVAAAKPPSIKFGRARSASGGYAAQNVEFDLAFDFWTSYINKPDNSGGLLINGTRYLVEWVVYNDALIYQQLAYVDKVSMMFTAVGDFTSGYESVNGSGIPFINVGDYAYADDYGPYLPEVFSTVPNSRHFATNCFPLWTDVGVQNIAIGMINDTALSHSVLYIFNALAPGYNLNITFQDEINMNLSNLDSLIQKWARAEPPIDMLVTGASTDPDLSAQVVTAIRNSGWNPRGVFLTTGPEFVSWRKQLAWMADNIFMSTQWTEDLNYTDPVFGTNALMTELYTNYTGHPPIFSTASVIAGLNVAALALMQANSLVHSDVLAAVRAFNETTILGPIYFDSRGNAEAVTFLCIQTAYPRTHPLAPAALFPQGQSTMAYPGYVPYPPGYFDQPSNTGMRIAIGLGIGLGLLAAAVLGGVIYYVVAVKYHVIVLDKGKTEGNWE